MNTPAYAITTGLTVLAATGVWRLMWMPTCLDEFRQSIFTLRDDLFMDAAVGNDGLGLNTPIYRSARAHMNRLIRYSHGLSFGMFLFTKFRKPIVEPPTSDFQREFLAMPDGPAKKRYDDLQEQMRHHVAELIIKRSFVLCSMIPIFGLAVVPIALMHGIRDGVAAGKAIWQNCRRKVDNYLAGPTCSAASLSDPDCDHGWSPRAAVG